jgi:hypothetical protein
MKRHQRQQMADMTEEDIIIAFRRRIQLQALFHHIGQSVPEHVVMRFRKAGTWDAKVPQPVSEEFLAVLTEKDHPQRISISDGPLVASNEDRTRWIIDVSDQLVSIDPKVRAAAFDHFIGAQSHDDCWVSDFVLELLRRHTDAIRSEDESVWINAGLELRDAINRDFRVNCAGLKQASKLQFDESYQEFFSKVIRPRAHCFDHDRPSICNPVEEAERIRSMFEEWSSLDDLESALNRYLAFCGYLPLASDLSAGSLIAAWQRCHTERDVWTDVWKWVESCPSVLAQYHAAHAFLERPQWIRCDEIEKLLNVIRSVVNSSESESSCVQAPLWRLRSLLLQHYQVHLESMAPGLNSEVVSAAACWMTELVANMFEGEPAHVGKGYDFLLKEVLPLSWRKWFMARSRMSLSPMRVASLYTSFIWGDSLLATAVRRFADFPECTARDEFRTFLLTRLTSALCVGNLRTVQKENPSYAFDLHVSFSDFEPSYSPTDDEVSEAARQILEVRTKIEETSGLKDLLSNLRELPNEVCSFLCANLQSWRVELSNSDSIVCEFLNDNEWRKAVFQRLPLDALGNLVSFLTDWQLQHDEEWLLRVPHIFAFECENASEQERRELLLFATAVSSMAADIASPVMRLIVGSKHAEIAGQFETWRKTTRDIARESEPWLAARVRGFLGTLESVT